jgi:hypothetical protein
VSADIIDNPRDVVPERRALPRLKNTYRNDLKITNALEALKADNLIFYFLQRS